MLAIYGAANTYAELKRQVRIVVAHLHPPAFEFACQFYEGYAKLALFLFLRHVANLSGGLVTVECWRQHSRTA